MSEIATPNLKTFYQGDSGDRGEGDVFGTTDWDGGANKAASCAPGIGINTGDYDPKVTDWSQDERTAQKSQTIGHTQAGITVDQDPDFNDNVSFVQATASTAPDAEFGTTGAFNKTGKTVPQDSWAWGLVPNA